MTAAAAPRILLLMGPETYRATDFVEAASRVSIQLVVGTSRALALAEKFPERYLQVPLDDADSAIEVARSFQQAHPLDAVLAVDDEGVLAAAAIAAALNLPHNSLAAAAATRNKLQLRRTLTEHGLSQPWFRGVSDAAAAERVDVPAWPVVVKPVGLSASRGVIRAEDREGLVNAVGRVLAILDSDADAAARNASGEGDTLVVEEYLEGGEVAVEGVVRDGRLTVLAVFDKPDPLEGPYFEETLYVTPSRLPPSEEARVIEQTRNAVEALGLTRGPIHAELRLTARGPVVLEIAPRTIGGLCSRVLRFGTGMSLEELVLRDAAGLELPTVTRESPAAGVMMLPIPSRGRLAGIGGVEQARGVSGVEDVVQTLPDGAEAVPLPEGRRYLGFIFARGDTPRDVEDSLRQAEACLEIRIENC